MKLKRTLLLLAIISLGSIESCKASPIKITQSQIEAVFTPGNSIRLFMDSTSRPVDVGRIGGPNVYDFSNLQFYQYDSCSVFSVAQIPQLALRFPPNAVTSNEEGNTVFPVFSFANDRLYREGRGRITSDTTEWYQHFFPRDEWLRFPIAFNTQFSAPVTASVETTYVNGIPTNTSSDTNSGATTYVDGFGTMLLPGGVTFECLRVRIVASPPSPGKEFHFWTREGAVILIGSDSSQPDTGVVKRDYVIYFSPQTRSEHKRD